MTSVAGFQLKGGEMKTQIEKLSSEKIYDVLLLKRNKMKPD